jgi:hypothetical protein
MQSVWIAARLLEQKCVRTKARVVIAAQRRHPTDFSLSRRREMKRRFLAPFFLKPTHSLRYRLQYVAV